MIKFSELKTGDFVMAEYEGQAYEGEVVNLNGDEKQVCISDGAREFWFNTEDLKPILLDDAQLLRMNFQKQENEDGTVKYMKGVFRMMIPAKDNFSHFEIWYRDEKRQIMHPISVHQLQNHYLDMTKVHLTSDPV